MTPTDAEILNFINKPNFKNIEDVSKILKQTIIEILKDKKKYEQRIIHNRQNTINRFGKIPIVTN